MQPAEGGPSLTEVCQSHSPYGQKRRALLGAPEQNVGHLILFFFFLALRFVTMHTIMFITQPTVDGWKITHLEALFNPFYT